MNPNAKSLQSIANKANQNTFKKELLELANIANTGVYDTKITIESGDPAIFAAYLKKLGYYVTQENSKLYVSWSDL